MQKIALRMSAPWLIADLGFEHRILSWSLNKPGFQCADRVVWREVRNADLPRDLDPKDWLNSELALSKFDDAPAFMTSRGIDRHVSSRAEVDGILVETVATVGLSNAERVGVRRTDGGPFGTINILARVSVPLTDAAMIEALSIVTEARTLAVLEAGHDCGTGIATGTGTDCIAIAAPLGADPHEFAGLHTALGEALGSAVLNACRPGVKDWLCEQAVERSGMPTVA